MDLVRRLPARALLLAAAVVFAAGELAQLLPLAVGVDFVPLRHAAQDLLAGESVYRDPMFVYPPTAAVVLLPAVAGGETAAFGWWLVVVVAALVLTAVLVARLAPARDRLPFAALTVLALLGSVTAHGSLYAGNLSALLPPVAVGTLVAFHRGRWTLGCALLAASFLVKPLLAPLILVPLLSGRWRATATTMVPAGAILLAGMAFLPGGSRFPAVFRYTLSGSNLHGREAVHNLSLRGWAESHQAPALLGVLAAATVALLVATRLRPASRRGAGPAWLGGVLLLATFLAGGLAEVNYLGTAVAAALTHLALTRAETGRRSLWWPAPGLAMLAIPAGCVTRLLPTPAAVQTWLVTAELLLLAGLLATHRRAGHPLANATAERPPPTREAQASPNRLPNRIGNDTERGRRHTPGKAQAGRAAADGPARSCDRGMG